jgi:hypothetical protein
VKSARNGVAAIAELSTRVENCEDNFERWFLFDWMDIYWNSAAVINYSHSTIGKKGDVDLGAISCKRFIDCVIDDFVNQVMQAPLAGGTDIHSRALTDRFEALQDGDCAGVIRLRNLLLRHKNPLVEL